MNHSAEKYNNTKSSIPAHPTFVNDALVTFTFDLQNNRVQPLTMVNMSAKFDEEAHNGLVSIMLSCSQAYYHIHCSSTCMSIATFTSDL